MSRLLLLTIPLVLAGGALFLFGLRTVLQGESAPTPTAQPTQQARIQSTVPAATSRPPDELVRLAWFYKPPEEAQLDTVAQNFDFFILTYKDENERDALKSKGVQSPFSQYLLFLVIEDPGACDENPSGNQVAFKEGDFCQISEQHPDWFLLDQNGERIKSGKDTYHMDPGSEGFRQFWLERARELQETYGWDHIFLDNVEASRGKMVEDGQSLTNYPDDESYQAAVEGFLAYIRQDYFQPNGRHIYGNIVSMADGDDVWDRYLQHMDGAMIESFATDWSDGYRSTEDWELQMDLAERTLAQGKTLILVAQGDEDDQDLQRFSFASYLLIADGNAVFRYTHSDNYRDVWLYPNYDQDLGTPKGKRYKQQDTWRRDFSNGYVTVNPEDHQAEIVLNP